jgi:sugar phosphate isomerase/epimerase
MIESIGTPVLLTKESDLRTRVNLLNEGLKGRFPMGIEVVGGLDNFTDPEKYRAMVRNARLARELGVEFIAVHSPVTRDNYKNAPTNLMEPDFHALEKVVWLAEEIGAELLSFHAEVHMGYKEAKSLISRAPIYKALTKTFTRLEGLTDRVLFNLENMPWPLMGDVFRTAEEMIFDPVFSDVDELWLFAESCGCDVTFDTCHWGAAAENLHELVFVFSSISDHATHVHLSDVKGEWDSGRTLFEEGIVLGEGKLGTHLREFVLYLRDSNSSSVSLTLEINDRDFSKLEESRRSLQKLMEWL